MKKRGISPLIATVLIIGFVILLASMTFIWGGDVVTKYTTETEKESLSKLTCTTKVNLNIKEACDLGTSIRIRVESMADQNIDSLIYRILSPSDAAINTIQDDELVDIQLAPFESKVFYPKYFAVDNMYTKPNKIEIFPRIIIDGEESTCPGTSKEIIPCYILPSLNDLSDWTITGETKKGLFKEDIKPLFESFKINIEDEEGIYAHTYNENSKEWSTETITLIPIDFIIPETADFIFVRFYSSASNGELSYELKVDGEIQETITDPIQVTEGGTTIGYKFDLTDVSKGTAHLTITQTNGGFLAITKLGYIIE